MADFCRFSRADRRLSHGLLSHGSAIALGALPFVQLVV
jgi:hypothetical protein